MCWPNAWSEDGAPCVDAAMEPERAAAMFGRGGVGDEGIAWCTAYPFADPVEDAGRDDHGPHGRGGDQKFRDSSGAVACGDERPSGAAVSPTSGRELRDGGRAVGDAFHDAERGDGCAQHRGEEDRQDRIQQF